MLCTLWFLKTKEWTYPVVLTAIDHTVISFTRSFWRPSNTLFKPGSVLKTYEAPQDPTQCSFEFLQGCGPQCPPCAMCSVTPPASRIISCNSHPFWLKLSKIACIYPYYAVQKLCKNQLKADDIWSDILMIRVHNLLVSVLLLSHDYSCDRCLHHKPSNHQWVICNSCGHFTGNGAHHSCMLPKGCLWLPQRQR